MNVTDKYLNFIIFKYFTNMWNVFALKHSVDIFNVFYLIIWLDFQQFTHMMKKDIKSLRIEQLFCS